MDMLIAKPERMSATNRANLSPQPMSPAVEATLRENHNAFLRYLARRLGDRDTAEDVLQQFYLRVLRRSTDLRKVESVVAWLYTVLRTTLIDHYRQETSRRNRNSEYALMLSLTEEPWDAESSKEGCAYLNEVLETLPPKYSDILLRVDLYETPPRKVAVDLGIAANTARVRLHRARQALKRAMLCRCENCPERNIRNN